MNDYLIWLDHKEARVLHVHPDSFSETTVPAPKHIQHRHPGSQGGTEHPEDAKHFFQEIARSVAGTDGVLVVGPSTAKLAFIRYVHAHDAALEKRIVGVETVDHPSDKQLVAYAKHYFHQGSTVPAAADAPGTAPGK